VFAELAGSGSDASLKLLYDHHRWFELRDALQGKQAPPLYVGAVASAFNNVKRAEEYLNKAAERASTVEEAVKARGMLAYLYTRLGRSRDAVHQLDEILRLEPGSPDVLNARTLFAAFNRYPDQSIGRNRHSSISCTANARGLILPVSVNGKTVRWIFDSGLSRCPPPQVRRSGTERCSDARHPRFPSPQ
jgi:tetratricopeptide (TPR) repeat protein